VFVVVYANRQKPASTLDRGTLPCSRPRAGLLAGTFRIPQSKIAVPSVVLALGIKGLKGTMLISTALKTKKAEGPERWLNPSLAVTIQGGNNASEVKLAGDLLLGPRKKSKGMERAAQFPGQCPKKKKAACWGNLSLSPLSPLL